MKYKSKATKDVYSVVYKDDHGVLLGYGNNLRIYRSSYELERNFTEDHEPKVLKRIFYMRQCGDMIYPTARHHSVEGEEPLGVLEITYDIHNGLKAEVIKGIG
jgi:hypothetical protein